jgi:hypothetical protein
MFSCAGIDTANPVHSFNSHADMLNNATLTLPALSPTIADALLFWCGYHRANNVTASSTISSTGTELFDVNLGTSDPGRGVFGGYYEQLVASGTTGTRTTTSSQAAGQKVGTILALNPASTVSMTQHVGMIPIG